MATITPTFKHLASGLRFPEGPMAMPDGSVILVEIARQTLSRVAPDGKVTVIAALGFFAVLALERLARLL